MNAWPVAQIGELVRRPQTWNPTTSGRVISFIYVDLTAVNRDEKQIEGPRRIATKGAPSRARQLVASGDVLVSTVRPNLNAVARVQPELDGATASTGFCVLRPRRDALDGNYLFHWVRTQHFVSAMTERATGANYPAVSDRIVLESLIPLPPLPEQRRIAGVLDRAEALRAKRRAALAQLDTLTQSVFLDMFGDPATNPNAFPQHPLIEFVDPDRPITYGILMPGPHQESGVDYVRVVDMVDGGISLASVRKTTEAISDSYRRSLVATEDLLMSIRGHVGRCAVVPRELDGANITQDTARLAITNAVPTFIRECLRSAGLQHWMARHTKGVAVRGINLGDVKRIPVIAPPRDQQQRFAERAAAVDRLRAVHRTALAQLDALFSALQHRAFRGEL